MAGSILKGSLAVALVLCFAVGCKPKVPPVVDSGAPVVKKKPQGPVAPGETRIDTEKSKLSLTIIKDRDTKSPVTATMGMRDGAIALGPGTARLSIDLDSFDSAIPLRNERVRGIFFETSGIGWDSAEVTIGKIPDDALASLRDKKKVAGVKLDAEIKMHGKSVKVSLPVEASNVGGTLFVKSSQPIEVKVSDFGLTDNLKRLSSVCMHDSIDDIVKVDVALEFPNAG